MVYEVYPRVCGGTSKTYRPPHALEGLSPRVRGNPFYSMLRLISHRSIPACAGEPLSDLYLFPPLLRGYA